MTGTGSAGRHVTGRRAVSGAGRRRLLRIGSHTGRAPLMIDRRSLLVLAGSAAVSWPRLGYAAEVDMVAVPESTKARLLELARMRGRLPVIVGLAVPFRSEDEVGPAETAAREAAMTRARARLLKDLGVVAARDGSLSGPGIINVKLFETIPFLALTAEPEALERLLAHPLVDSVQEDATVAPL
jgi:hypothetical protein